MAIASHAAAASKRVKILPTRATGKVLEWKGKHGWIQPDQPITHAQAAMHRGKVFFSQADVEAEIDGIGARVSFFVYADGTGLGAMSVRPHTTGVVKTVIKPLHQTPQQPQQLVQQKPGLLRPQAAKAAGPQLVSALSTAPRPVPVVHPGKAKPPAAAGAVRPTVLAPTKPGAVATKPGAVAPTKLGLVLPNKLGIVTPGKVGTVAPTKLAAKPAATAPAAKGTAAKGAGKGGPTARRRVGEDAVMGTVHSWKGVFGWIKTDEPIENFKGLVYVGATDCEDKSAMADGVEVAFYPYADARGVGAECCAVGIVPAEGMPRTPVAAEAAAPAAAAASAAPGVQAPGPVLVTKPAKAKPAGPKPAGPKPAGLLPLPLLKPSGVVQTSAFKPPLPLQGIKRKRITELEVMGEVTEWKGTFGWITPQDPIEHAEASKNEGRVKVMNKDIVGDAKKLEEGQLVQFHVYVDGSGLGAEECLPF